MTLHLPDLAAGAWLRDLPTEYHEPWLLESIWTRSGFNLIVGEPKSRKSTLRRYWTACALAGQPAFGKFKCVSPAKKAWLAFGEGPPEAEGAANHAAFEPFGGDSADRLRLRKMFDFRLENKEHVALLRDYLAGEGFDLVMFDPLLYFHDQDENDSRGMGRVCEGLLTLAEVAATVVVHHTGKVMVGQERSVAHAGRGSSTLGGAAETVIRVKRANMGSRHTLEFVTRGGEEPAKLNLLYDTLSRQWLTTEVGQLAEAIMELVRSEPGIDKGTVVERLKKRRDAIFAEVDLLQRLGLLNVVSSNRSHLLYRRNAVPDPSGTRELV